MIGNDHIANQIILSCVSSTRKFNQTTKKIHKVYLVHLERGCLLSFTKREMKLLYDSYFEVIGEMEKYIEVKSVNTEHCWNVFKHTCHTIIARVLKTKSLVYLILLQFYMIKIISI